MESASSHCWRGLNKGYYYQGRSLHIYVYVCMYVRHYDAFFFNCAYPTLILRPKIGVPFSAMALSRDSSSLKCTWAYPFGFPVSLSVCNRTTVTPYGSNRVLISSGDASKAILPTYATLYPCTFCAGGRCCVPPAGVGASAR